MSETESNGLPIDPDPLPRDPTKRHQIVVFPDHYHERVDWPERCFYRQWGMDRIMADVHHQLVALGLLPYRRFVSDDEQWMYADVLPKNAGRVVHHLEHQFRAMNLPVQVFSQPYDANALRPRQSPGAQPL